MFEGDNGNGAGSPAVVGPLAHVDLRVLRDELATARANAVAPAYDGGAPSTSRAATGVPPEMKLTRLRHRLGKEGLVSF